MGPTAAAAGRLDQQQRAAGDASRRITGDGRRRRRAGGGTPAHHPGAALLDGGDQRAALARLGARRVRPPGEQQLAHVLVPVLHRLHQRPRAVVVGARRVPARRAQQQPAHVHVAAVDGVRERRVVVRVRLRPATRASGEFGAAPQHPATARQSGCCPDAKLGGAQGEPRRRSRRRNERKAGGGERAGAVEQRRRLAQRGRGGACCTGEDEPTEHPRRLVCMLGRLIIASRTLAPWSSSSCTTSTCPSAAGRSRQRHNGSPSTLAPRSSSSLTSSTCPLSMAPLSAVQSGSSGRAPCSSSSLACAWRGRAGAAAAGKWSQRRQQQLGLRVGGVGGQEQQQQRQGHAQRERVGGGGARAVRQQQLCLRAPRRSFAIKPRPWMPDAGQSLQHGSVRDAVLRQW